MTVQTLIFFEIIIVLVTLCVLLFLYALKQRELRQRVLQEYRKLQQICVNENIPIDEPGIDPAPTPPAVDPVVVFLEQAHHQAQARYLQLTQATVPRLAPELPYGSKIAALRFIYTMAELYAYQHPPGSQAHWLALERKLVDVARWIGQEGRHQKPQVNHRLRLLQERVDALKPFEQESIRLQRQLALAKSRQKKLELAHNESQQTIINLQQRLRSLRRAHGGSKETPAQFQQRFRHYGSQDYIRDAKESFTSTMSQTDAITSISNRKNLLLKNIAANLNHSYTDMAPAQRKRLEDAIKSLEKDVLKSDHHIANLKRELKQTRDSLLQQPLVVTAKPPAGSKNTQAEESGSTDLSAADKAEHIEEVLKVIHTNLAQGEQALADEIRVRDPANHQRTLAEIQQLRLNNQSQRNMIIDLEKELQALRRESLEAEDEAVSKEKNEDIARLEHLVKECEYCIETLESQVDLLHMQLEEGYVKQAAEVDKVIDPDILKMNEELENTSKKLKDTLKQYQQSATINRFALEIMQCDSVEAVARRLIHSLKDLQINVGFTLHSLLGDAEFFTGNLFNPEEKARIKSAAPTSNISYLNDSILFTNNHLHLLLKNPPTDDEEQASQEATLTALIDLASERLQSLEAKTQHHAQKQHLSAWLGTAKDHLSELNVQRVNQAEESRHVMENLMAELRHATEMIEMSPRARAVFDNAMNECHQRMEMILESGGELDRNFAEIFADIEKISQDKKTVTPGDKIPKLPR